MDSITNMRKVLNESGAYELDGSGLVDQELAAYGAGLEPIEDGLQQLEEDLFAMTAGTGRLGTWERLYRRQASSAGADMRRRGVARALSCRGGPVLREHLPGILDAAGINGSAREENGKLIIHVDSLQGTTEAEAKRLLGRLLPLNVTWETET